MKWIPYFQKDKGQWFSKSVSHSKAVTTEELCEDIAAASTMSPADVTGVVRALSDAMVKYLADGRPVKLDRIGTFRLTASASGNGVEREEDCSAAQFNSVTVRFLPDKRRRPGGQSGHVPVLALGSIPWERVKALRPRRTEKQTDDKQ